MNYEWKCAKTNPPETTKHVIIADGGIISQYAYYLKPKNKWYKNWKCKEEIDEPTMWTDMPDVPKESIMSNCCG